MAVGVPEMAPFEDESDRPVGNEGEIDQEVTVPATVGVTVDMATFCVKSKTVGLYEMVGAERPLVIIGSWEAAANSGGASSVNHWSKLRSATLEEMESVMTVKLNSLELPSIASGAREARMMPAERDIVISITTRNTDLTVFWGGSRYSARSSMLQIHPSPFLKGYPVSIGIEHNKCSF